MPAKNKQAQANQNRALSQSERSRYDKLASIQNKGGALNNKQQAAFSKLDSKRTAAGRKEFVAKGSQTAASPQGPTVQDKTFEGLGIESRPEGFDPYSPEGSAFVQKQFNEQNAIGDEELRRQYRGLEGLGSAAAQNLLGGAQDMYAKGWDPESAGVAKLPGVDDFSAERARVEQAQYDRLAKGLDDRFSRQNEDFQQQMANRGIPMGSQLYEQQKKLLQDAQNSERLDYRNQAVLSGGGEQSRMFGLGAQAHQIGMGDYATKWNAPFQTASGLMGLGSQAWNAARPETVDYFGAANQAGAQGRQAGYDEAAQAREFAYQRALQAQAERAARARGGSSGGGSGLDDWYAKQDYLAKQRQAEMENQYRLADQYKPKGPSTKDQIIGGLIGLGGSFAGGYASGLGKRMGG